MNVIILQKRSLRIFGCTFFVNSSVNDCSDILSLCKGAHHSYVCSIVSSRIRAKAGKTPDGVTCSIYLRTNRSARRGVLRGESHQTRVIDKVVLANHYSHSIFGLCPIFPPGVEELLSLEVRQSQTQSLSILFTEELWLQALVLLLVSIYIYYVSFRYSWLASGDLSSKVCKLVEAWAAMRHDVNRKTRCCFVNTSKILIASSCGSKAITWRLNVQHRPRLNGFSKPSQSHRSESPPAGSALPLLTSAHFLWVIFALSENKLYERWRKLLQLRGEFKKSISQLISILN